MSKPMWEVFSRLVYAVREDHRMKNALVGTGHDFAHALMVAQYCQQIADEPLATLGWISAICHNTDRLFGELSNGQIADKVRMYLDNTDVQDGDKELVVDAVMCHSHKPSPIDSALTIVLMDADKLANIGYLIVIRSAQFYPHLPPVNLLHLFNYPPRCNYRNPGSICRNIASSLEWEKPGWFRIPKAIELAKPLFEKLRQFNNGILQQYNDVGLLPYPFPEDFKP